MSNLSEEKYNKENSNLKKKKHLPPKKTWVTRLQLVLCLLLMIEKVMQSFLDQYITRLLLTLG